MGRMLESMKLGQPRRGPLNVAAPSEDRPVQPCVTDWEIAEEVPYVEVGDPNKKLEASAGVLKHAPQAVPQPPHLPIERTAAKSVALSPAPTTTVAFEPWHDAPAPAEISPEIIAYHQPDHATSKEYAAMFDAMRGGLKTSAANVLLIAGLKPGIGASTVLLNLAASAATKHALRVAVIELNVDRAGLSKRLGHHGTSGLSDVLAGTLALEHALVTTACPSLRLLPAGKPTAKLTSGALTWLIAWLRERFDLILLDGPSMDDAGAPALPIPQSDAVYLVLPHGAPANASKSAAQSISGMGGRLCGLIHTRFGSQAPG